MVPGALEAVCWFATRSAPESFDQLILTVRVPAVEWVAAQPWCDGNVGMVGISYFAITQIEAAVAQPPI